VRHDFDFRSGPRVQNALSCGFEQVVVGHKQGVGPLLTGQQKMNHASRRQIRRIVNVLNPLRLDLAAARGGAAHEHVFVPFAGR